MTVSPYPLEKAGQAHREVCGMSDTEALKAAITAFLEAAAEDDDLCLRVGDAAYDKAELSYRMSGQDAILALKEAVNG